MDDEDEDKDEDDALHLTHLPGRCAPLSFPKLPAWVRTVATGRPNLKDYFSHRKPHWIEPLSEDNGRDIAKLIREKLEARACVAPADITEATQILLGKSKVCQ